MSMDPKLAAQIARIETLLAEKFGASRGSLARRAQKPGRALPRRVRKDLERLARAQGMTGHPKLSRMIDGKDATRAAIHLRDWLEEVDVADRRKGRVLDLLGTLSFNLILVFVLLIAVLRWRGFV